MSLSLEPMCSALLIMCVYVPHQRCPGCMVSLVSSPDCVLGAAESVSDLKGGD